MRYTIKSVSPPSGSPPITEPISLDELKANISGTTGFSDDMLSTFITSAREALELWLGRTIATQSLLLIMDRLPPEHRDCAWPPYGQLWPFRRGDMIKVPRPPLQAVTSFTIIDSDGSDATLTEDTDFTVDALNEPGWLSPVSSWPTTKFGVTNAVQIEFVAGYPDGAVPSPLRQAILLMSGTGVRTIQSASSGVVKSESIDGVGSTTYDVSSVSSGSSSEYMISPAVRWLTDPYRIPNG